MQKVFCSDVLVERLVVRHLHAMITTLFLIAPTKTTMFVKERLNLRWEMNVQFVLVFSTTALVSCVTANCYSALTLFPIANQITSKKAE